MGTEIAQVKIFKLNPTFLPKAIIAIFIVASGYVVFQNVTRDEARYDGPYSLAAAEMFEFVREHATRTDIVIFRKPRVMTLMTDVHSARFAKPEDYEKLDGISYLVIDENNLSDQLPASYVDMQSNAQNLERVFQNNQFKIYKVINMMTEKTD